MPLEPSTARGGRSHSPAGQGGGRLRCLRIPSVLYSVAETNEDIDQINPRPFRSRGVVGATGIVIGSLGPRPSWSAPDFRQLSILTSSGVDALVLETAQPDQLVTALEAIRSRTTLPLIVSVFVRPRAEDLAKISRPWGRCGWGELPFGLRGDRPDSRRRRTGRWTCPCSSSPVEGFPGNRLLRPRIFQARRKVGSVVVSDCSADAVGPRSGTSGPCAI